jgi:hypothetical protein
MQLDFLNTEALFVIGYISVVFILFLMIIISCIKISTINIKKFISEYNYLDSTKND